MVKIGIVGSRRRNSRDDFNLLWDVIVDEIRHYGVDNIVLISGGCKEGADSFAEAIQEGWNFPTGMIIHYPDKSKLDPELLKKNPRAAYTKINHARNQLIAEDSDRLIAMVAPDRKGGTEDTIKWFKRLGKTALILI